MENLGCQLFPLPRFHGAMGKAASIHRLLPVACQDICQDRAQLNAQLKLLLGTVMSILRLPMRQYGLLSGKRKSGSRTRFEGQCVIKRGA